MFFSFDLTIPPNTTAAVPLTRDVQLPPGTIHKVDVQFPAGCVGLAHTLCRRGAHQVWPANDGGDFNSNGQVVSWEDEYDLDAAPFTLRLVAWNLDDFYGHTVTWRFALRSFPQTRKTALLQELYQMEITGAEGGP